MRRRLVALVIVAAALGGACKSAPNMKAGGGFFDLPWPNDVRKAADGSIDLTGAPGSWNGLVSAIFSKGAVATKGFGANAASYFTFSAPLAAWSLPTPQSSTGTGSPLQIVNIDPGSPRYGERVPVSANFKPTGSMLRPFNLLTVLPYPGFVLEEDTTYAVVLFTGLRDSSGGQIQRAPLVDRLASPWTADTGFTQERFDALAAQRSAVMSYVAAETSWATNQVAAFTVYTTQQVTPEMDAVAAAVEALPAPGVTSANVMTACGPSPVARIQGKVALPRWQQGASPYISAGGEIAVGPGGQALLGGWEEADYEIVFPCTTAPAAGWPVIVEGDGTGAWFTSASSFVNRYFPPPYQLRYAVISVSPYMTGARRDPAIDDLADELARLGIPISPDDLESMAYFNFLNPVAGRNNQRQGAADHMWLKRVARGFSLPGGPAGAPSDLTTDDSLVTFYGHSQGSVSGPLLLAEDPEFAGAFLSAPGAGLYHALVHRGDVRPLIDAVLLAPSGELDEFHPVVQIMQTLAEAGDAANYAGAIQTPHVVMTEGVDDGCSVRETAEHGAAAAGFPVADPPLLAVFAIQTLQGRAPVALPAAGNDAGRTRVLLQLDAGHFGVQANPQLVREFFDDLLDTGTPTVPAGPFTATSDAQCIRYDP